MTEPEWLAATDPYPLQAFLAERDSGDPRRWRLFAAACCRHVLHHGDGSLDDLLPAFERLADGLLGEDAFARLRAEATRRPPPPADSPADCVWSAIRGEAASARSSAVYSCDAASGAVVSASVAVEATVAEIARHPDGHRYFAERLYQTRLVRDIFGNPFRLVGFDPAWQTEAVVGLARGVYEDRAFDRLPVLADALEDAGCADPDILAHCRDDGPHVRGCWVVDLVLGKG